MFHDEIGAPVGSCAGVEQASDMGVIELREDGAFAREEKIKFGRPGFGMDELNGDPTLEGAVGAAGEKYGAHATCSDGAQ